MSKTWDLTVNNYTEANVKWLESISEEVNRIHVSKEVGDEGTPHLQGRITFKRTYRLKGLKKLSGDQFHWEPTKCTQDSLYVLKHDSEVIIQQNNGEAGKRTDLKRIAERLDAGGSPEDMLDDPECLNVMARYGPFVAKLHAHKRRRKEYSAPYVKVFYGSSGTNKTRRAYEEAGEDVYVWEPSQDKWFDGYHGQRSVIFDEFRGQLPLGMMLRLLDGYPHTKVQIKGGFVDWSPTKIFITSPKDPVTWYTFTGEQSEQLIRRIVEKVQT